MLKEEIGGSGPGLISGALGNRLQASEEVLACWHSWDSHGVKRLQGRLIPRSEEPTATGN